MDSLVIAVASFFMDVSSKDCPGVHKTSGFFFADKKFSVHVLHRITTVLHFNPSTAIILIVMSSTKPKSAFLTVRVTGSTRSKFHAKAKRFGQPSEVLRELIEAFVQDRLTIQPPVTGNSKENLYEPRI